jgi:saccharopine dehydrogenase-like NADP-dependent oxidoreductase
MPTTAVLGATGTLGRRVLARLDDADALVLVGRDGDALGRLAAERDGAVTVRTLPADADVDRLAGALEGVDVAVAALPVTGGLAQRVAEAAVLAGTDLVDTVDAQPYLRWAYDDLDGRARTAGVTVVPGIGWRTAIGDLLTAVAAGHVDGPRDVHVATVVPDRGGVLGTASAGVRAAVADGLGRPGTAFTHGARVEELPGEQRRLAWFPRPVGPHHAVGVPGLEPISVPHHLATVRNVRSYVALSTSRAELLQAAANLAQRPRVRAWLAARLAVAPHRAAPGARWAVVAEVAGAEDELARAWMNGRDHLDASARLVAAVVAAVRRGQVPSGVRPPALVDAPRDLLDALTADSEIRWSVADPRGG